MGGCHLGLIQFRLSWSLVLKAIKDNSLTLFKSCFFIASEWFKLLIKPTSLTIFSIKFGRK